MYIDVTDLKALKSLVTIKNSKSGHYGIAEELEIVVIQLSRKGVMPLIDYSYIYITYLLRNRAKNMLQYFEMRKDGIFES